MTAQLITWMTVAWQALMGNNGWMAWNLFLALVPLGMSFWLFHPQPPLSQGPMRKPSRVLRWGVGILLGATFVIGIGRSNFARAIGLLRNARAISLDIEPIYLVGAIALTFALMGADIWLLRHREGVRSLHWWVGFMVFVAFLPNAPYVLTDVIHLIEDIRRGYSVWIITLAIIPQYLLFMVIGFEAYVLSLIYLGEYLKQQGWGKFILGAELILHSLSAIGIYLGRFQRFNSWHIITQPDELVMSVVSDLTGKRPALVMIVTFLAIASLYWLMKQVSLGIIYYYRNQAIAPSPKASEPDSEPAQSS